MILYAPNGINSVTRGEADNETHYLVNRDGSVEVPDNEVGDFLVMGFTEEFQRTELPAPPTLASRARPS